MVNTSCFDSDPPFQVRFSQPKNVNVKPAPTCVFIELGENGDGDAVKDFRSFHEVNVHHANDDVKRTKREDPKQPTLENRVGRIRGRTTQNESET